MAELEEDVIFVRTDTTTFSYFHCHRTGDNISTGEILGSRCIPLHEPFTFRVYQESTLASGSLSDQAACAVDTSGVELDEFHILVW